jgi:hypothetical protein
MQEVDPACNQWTDHLATPPRFKGIDWKKMSSLGKLC